MPAVPIVERERDGTLREILGREGQHLVQVDNRSLLSHDLEVLPEQLRWHRQVERIVARGLDAVIEKNQPAHH